jgi:hypothetical protein
MTQCKNAPREKTSTAGGGQTGPVPAPQQQQP